MLQIPWDISPPHTSFFCTKRCGTLSIYRNCARASKTTCCFAGTRSPPTPGRPSRKSSCRGKGAARGLTGGSSSLWTPIFPRTTLPLETRSAGSSLHRNGRCGCREIVGSVGYRVSVIGYRVSGIGCRVSGIEYWVSGIGYRVSGIEYRESDIGDRVSDIGDRDRGSGMRYRVPGIGCRV